MVSPTDPTTQIDGPTIASPIENPMPPPKKPVHTVFYIILTILLIILGLLTLITWQPQLFPFFMPPPSPATQPITQPTLTPKPTAVPKPIPSGRQVYRFSHGTSVTGPKITEAVINPLDPKTGQAQIITVTIAGDVPVGNIAVVLQTDHQKKSYPMKQTGGNEKTGTWQADIIWEDSFEVVYEITFDMTSQGKSYSNGLHIR